MNKQLLIERRRDNPNQNLLKKEELHTNLNHPLPLKHNIYKPNTVPKIKKQFNQFLLDSSTELINYRNSWLSGSQKKRAFALAVEFRKGVDNRSIDDYKMLIIGEEEIFSKGKKSNKSPIASRNVLLQKDYQKACWLCSLGRYKRLITRLKAKVTAQFPAPSFDLYKEIQSSSFEKTHNAEIELLANPKHNQGNIAFITEHKTPYKDEFIRRFFAMSSKTSNLKFGVFGIDIDLETLSKQNDPNFLLCKKILSSFDLISKMPIDHIAANILPDNFPQYYLYLLKNAQQTIRYQTVLFVNNYRNSDSASGFNKNIKIIKLMQPSIKHIVEIFNYIKKRYFSNSERDLENSMNRFITFIQHLKKLGLLQYFRKEKVVELISARYDEISSDPNKKIQKCKNAEFILYLEYQYELLERIKKGELDDEDPNNG